MVKKLRPMLKFFDGRTDGRTDRQTDRVITIGHPPSGGALMIILLSTQYNKVYGIRIPKLIQLASST